jgi:DNA-binding MarR family transcriptional regulator
MKSEPVHSIQYHLLFGLGRIAAALRADEWSAASAVGLNPTQAHILTFLAGRAPDGMRIQAIAEHLGVSQPTATDSVNALLRKELVVKRPDSNDARASSVHVTAAGSIIVRGIGRATSATGQSLLSLDADEQASLLQVLIRLIRSLQLAKAIPVQRMCVSCRHFRPNTYPDAQTPHHCAFVNAAFGDRNLRLDCNDHEPADPSVETVNWTAFDKGSAVLRAANPS